MTQILYDFLKKLFQDPCLILMRGPWRKGKTDAALLLLHLGLKWKLLGKGASNIWTYNNPKVTYVRSMPHLKRWLHGDRITKLFIFDEALAHVPKRAPMSKTNVNWIRFLAEVSKGHGRIIIISQTSDIDKVLLNSTFLRAELVKVSLKRMMAVTSWGRFTFSDLPRSPIRFDKDVLAEWSNVEDIRYSDLSLEQRIARQYAEGISFTKMARELDMHQEQVKRNLRRYLKETFKKSPLRVKEPEPLQEIPLQSQA